MIRSVVLVLGVSASSSVYGGVGGGLFYLRSRWFVIARRAASVIGACSLSRIPTAQDGVDACLYSLRSGSLVSLTRVRKRCGA